jgi:hypothetical protein
MIKTEYGIFDGNKWEDICQLCFKKRYESEAYFEIKSTPGDYGIEGFTRTGKAFQCYCPDEHYTQDELYEKQRDKITKDLNKLKTFEKQLQKKLGGTLINKWYFVSPYYSKNDIVDHCTKKRNEIRDLQLSIIDNITFEVIPWDIENIKPEIHTFLKISEQKIDIISGDEITSEDKLKWKNQEISLVENAQRKHGLRFSGNTTTVEKKVDDLTEKSISHFLEGNGILKKWSIDYPDDYEKFVKIITQVEEQVIEECMFPSEDNNKLYKSFAGLLKEKIGNSFPFIEETMIQNLCNQVLADWILRCPINFEKDE